MRMLTLALTAHRAGSREQGFTLLELLIAIAIFSILAAIAYTGLRSVLDTEQQTSLHNQRLAKMQLGFNLMENDIEQAVPRPVRDAFGDAELPLRGSGFTGIVLEFTRGGIPNPTGLKRSGLQRVGYELEEDTLYRVTWPVLDRAQDTAPRRTALMDKVKSIEFVYYDQQMTRHDQWPPRETGSQSSGAFSVLPRGIEIIVESEFLGNIRRVFRLADLAAVTTL